LEEIGSALFASEKGEVLRHLAATEIQDTKTLFE